MAAVFVSRHAPLTWYRTTTVYTDVFGMSTLNEREREAELPSIRIPDTPEVALYKVEEPGYKQK